MLDVLFYVAPLKKFDKVFLYSNFSKENKTFWNYWHQSYTSKWWLYTMHDVWFVWVMRAICELKGASWTTNKLEYIHYSQFVPFQTTNFVCIPKKVWMLSFPLVMYEVIASRRDHAHHNALITSCTHRSESTSNFSKIFSK